MAHSFLNSREDSILNTMVLKEFEKKGVHIVKFAKAAYLWKVDKKTRQDIYNRIFAVRDRIKMQMKQDDEYISELKNIEERYEQEKRELEKEWKAKHFSETLAKVMKEP